METIKQLADDLRQLEKDNFAFIAKLQELEPLAQQSGNTFMDIIIPSVTRAYRLQELSDRVGALGQ